MYKKTGLDEGFEVLVVGAGPVGLATAVELGQRGVKVCIIEANSRVGNAPRAKTTNVRTCEHLRRWGLIGALRAKAPLGVDYPSTICFATRLAGHQIVSFDNAFYCEPGQNPLYSEHAQWIPQYKLEEVLKEHVSTLPNVSLLFNTQLLELAEHPEGVVASVGTADGTATIEAKYVVGADGARSTVRRLLDIPMEGSGGLSRNRLIVFRQPGLAQMFQLPKAIMYWLVNSDTPAVMGPLDSDDRWYIGGPASEATADPVDFIRRASGLDITPEVLSVDDWEAHRLLASLYRRGRVFLVGDACHLHPPYGGYGMNLGVGDAVDIGWKLAARLQGWGGEGLLDSYELERRPVHHRVIEEAVINHATRTVNLTTADIEAATDAGRLARETVAKTVKQAKEREFHTLGVVLGYRYTGSTIICYDGENEPQEHPSVYEPSSYPGCRAPHFWLRPDCEPGASIFDLFGQGFTLLCFDANEQLTAHFEKAAGQLGIPLNIVALDEPALRDLYAASFVLVRPDQHVAWRGTSMPADVEELLAKVTGASSQYSKEEG